jgi:hypothetical protein
MSTMTLLSLLIFGWLVGVASGMLGIGGSILVIPILMIAYRFTYPQAIGTSLGMLLPPIGILAFLAYYRAGQVDLRASALLALGFVIGAGIGGWLVGTGRVPEVVLHRVFALLLLYIGGNMLFKSDPRAWASLGSLGLLVVYTVGFYTMGLLGRRWDARWSLKQIYLHRRRQEVRSDYDI